MEDREILANAIDKAKANGYKYPYIDRATELIIGELATVYYIVFHHSFAKAFWGEEFEMVNNKPFSSYTYPDIPEQSLWIGDECEFTGKCWQYHLQQMVLEENPIKYLEKFL